jgi:hypothetical protein
VKESRGKWLENQHVRRFAANFAEFPEGELCASEHPDFLLTTPNRVIGIEHTRYINGDLSRYENVENIALRFASQSYERLGPPPVEVHVHWSFHDKVVKRTMQQFVNAFSRFVSTHLPAAGDEVTIRYPHWAWRHMPPEVDSVTISRRRTMTENFWVPTRGGSVPTLEPANLREIIEKKERKLPTYRQSCAEVWLLIVANGFEPSTHCDLAPEVERVKFKTDFDRVFFLHHFGGFVTELHTESTGMRL